ncbi:MAG: cyclic pyranopterin monophosphate synthase MoaC [Candidatus Eremiobacteraeota bacterium]|nr:cyclic pyranopterin monophosphate synthase MoaC [Candidatus Eremiobacteraeota bacterium]
MPAKLTHVSSDGSVRMVDVGAKAPTQRRAVAEAFVRMSPRALRALRAGAVKKGDVLTTAQIAGIAAAKRTSDLIPLCHPLALTHVTLAFDVRPPSRVQVRCETACVGSTGVEMEALTGAAVAALTIYDMCKALDRGMAIEGLRLLEKSGGRSGVFRRKRR